MSSISLKRSVIVIAFLCILLVGICSPMNSYGLTWKGPGGSATIDYMSKAKAFSWSVNPATTSKYSFTGTIVIESATKKTIYGIIPISASGKGRQSDVAGIPKYISKRLKKGKNYYAAYWGYSVDSKKQSYYIKQNVGIAFVY